MDLQLQDMWMRDITISMGLVNTNTTSMLLKTVESGKLEPKKLISHRFKLNEIEKAYTVFENAAKEKSFKTILSNRSSSTRSM